MWSLDALSPRLNAFVESLHRAGTVADLCGLLAAEARRVTGFDRALVYRFDRDWHGTVVAEDRNGVLPVLSRPALSGLRHPGPGARAVPPQRLRIIPDAGYVPVAIVPR